VVKVLVTGATGNVGTALVRALAAHEAVDRITGIARRAPARAVPAGTSWEALNVAEDDLTGAFAGADAVVHLAWAIQPSHDPRALWRTNVVGSARVFAAAAAAGVPVLVHASSVGVYSPGPKDRATDEGWPRQGTPSSDYARHKAAAEDRLDEVEAEHPEMRVVRMRPGLCFSREAATEVRRLFAGSHVPAGLLRPSRIVAVPDIPGLRFQAVHTEDAADAYCRAVVGDARGAFNIAAEPVLDPEALAGALGARRIPVPVAAARAAVAAGWRLRLLPVGPGWLDMALSVPVMDTGRAARELGWSPRRTSTEALIELLDGMADRAGAPTPPLAPEDGPMDAGPA
jgi:UDP-glucose 4-epimerase